jgi:hypothetical protein
MKRFLLVLCFVLFVGLAPAHADWFSLNSAEPAPPTVSLEAASADGLTFDVELAGFEYSEPHAGFVSLTLPEEGVAGQVGDPAVPVINRLVRVPYGADVRVSVEGSFEDLPITTFTGAPLLMPVQPPVPKILGVEDNVPFTINEDAYSNGAAVFATYAQRMDEGVLRGYRFILLQMRPVNYRPADDLLQVASHLRVTVKFVHPNMTETIAREERYGDPPTAALADALFPNAGSFGAKADHFTPAGYLIIGGKNLLNNAQVDELVAWETQRGFTVTVATIQDIGATTDAIRNYITNAYQTWDVPPAYVLLVGDTNVLPAFNGQAQPTCATDLYYAAVDGADYFADLSYEKNEWPGGAPWTQHATFMASNDNYNISEGTHNAVCKNYLQPAGFNCTKIYSHEGATTQQALAALQTGPTVHAYSGHGSETSWADGPPVNQQQVRSLTNTTFPLVLSHACLTGSFQLPECFAETWVRSPNGALDFWGASESTYWTEDDIIERAMFYGWFRGDGSNAKHLPWVSSMLNFSLAQLYVIEGATTLVHHYFEMYNLFGDPEVQLYSAPPATVAPQFDQEIQPNTQQLSIGVGQPYAMVGLTRGDTLLATTYADVSGDAVLTISETLQAGDKLTLTITGENLAPFVGQISVAGAADDDAVDDDAADDDVSDDDATDDDASDDDATDDDTGHPSGDDSGGGGSGGGCG